LGGYSFFVFNDHQFGFLKKKSEIREPNRGFGETQNQIITGSGYFKNPSKNCFLGNYLTFSKLLRTVVICLNWVFGFSENRDLWTLRATPIQGGVSNTHPTLSLTLKNLKRSEFSMFFSWRVAA
jgi:hypothetical protein